MVSTLNIVFIFSPSATEGQSPGHRCLSDQSEQRGHMITLDQSVSPAHLSVQVFKNSG